MSDFQVFLQFIGWGFLLYLSNRTIKRTELSRLKDQVVDQIEGLSQWIELELNIEKSKATGLSLERGYTGKISRIDLLFQQINSLAKCKLLDEDLLIDFWNLDITFIFSDRNLNELRLKEQDIIEKIDIAYHSTLFKENIFRKIFLNHKPEILGFLLPLVSLYYLFEIVSMFYN